MKKTCIDDAIARVRAFHEAGGYPTEGRPEPESVPANQRKLRFALLKEEWFEYCMAESSDNFVEIADSLADMLFVMLGTALTYGVPIGEVFEEVCRSNMSKFEGGASFDENGKLRKGDHFSPPDIASILSNRLEGGHGRTE